MTDTVLSDSKQIMTGAQSLIASLEAVGVEVIFGIPGGTILPAYDPLFDSKIRHILVRHEQGAAHAAEGYAVATGKVGVCMATSGPGATNLVTGLADDPAASRRRSRPRSRSPVRVVRALCSSTSARTPWRRRRRISGPARSTSRATARRCVRTPARCSRRRR